MGVSSGKEALRVLERDVDSKRRDLKRRAAHLTNEVEEDTKKATTEDPEIQRELLANVARKRTNLVNIIQRIGAMDALSIRAQDASDGADYVTLTDVMSSAMQSALDDMVLGVADELRAGMEAITGRMRMVQTVVDPPQPLPLAPIGIIVPPDDELEKRFAALRS